MTKLNLINKIKLTHDVYELIFESEIEIPTKPGQFMTFMLPSWLRRAYSIADLNKNNFHFIIKRIENWKWWSKEICDLDIGTILDTIWPVWHFTLREDSGNKLFIWTWTWFAPLYFQIISTLRAWDLSNIKLVFWVRTRDDIFYESVLKDLKNTFKNFDYTLYLSREDTFEYRKGYVWDFLNKENISNFNSFYMCWSPQMIWEVRWKLESANVPVDNIYFEQY